MKFFFALSVLLAAISAKAEKSTEDVRMLSAVFECPISDQSPMIEDARVVRYTAKNLKTYVLKTGDTQIFVRHGLKLFLENLNENSHVLIGTLETMPKCSSENRGHTLRPVPVNVSVEGIDIITMSLSPNCRQIDTNTYSRNAIIHFWARFGNQQDNLVWSESTNYSSLADCENSAD